MSSKVYYYCPKDRKQVLYVEDPSQIGLVVAERPKTCPRCKQSYYKWECISRAGK